MTSINQIANRFIRFLLLSFLVILLLFIIDELPYLVGNTNYSSYTSTHIQAKPETIAASLIEKKSLFSSLLAEVYTPVGFLGIATPLPQLLIKQMEITGSWQPGCPVLPSDLAYLELMHWGFDNQVHRGELVVHKSLAQNFLEVFAQLYEIHFPIEKMQLIEKYGANDEVSMSNNNSSAFNCREITRKPGHFSQHSYGRAVDINPLFNPYVTVENAYLIKQGWDGKSEKADFMVQLGYDTEMPMAMFCTIHPNDCAILPRESTIFIDRHQVITGLIKPNDPIVKIFQQNGFIWGGSWRNLLDFQHFEYQGKE